ncbi:MAG: hypothetical protein AABX03_00270 [Nanoarchaeota archaeon]
MRIKFKSREIQKKFLREVLIRTKCPSIKDFEQFGLDVRYSTMKNYFSAIRLLPKDLFDNLCHLSKIDPDSFDIELVSDYWGQVKGGSKAKLTKH